LMNRYVLGDCLAVLSDACKHNFFYLVNLLLKVFAFVFQVSLTVGNSTLLPVPPT